MKSGVCGYNCDESKDNRMIGDKLMVRKKQSLYEKCPVYETKQFIFRMVEENDAEDLLSCYSDKTSAKFFNSDNCTSDFIYKSLVCFYSSTYFLLLSNL